MSRMYGHFKVPGAGEIDPVGGAGHAVAQGAAHGPTILTRDGQLGGRVRGQLRDGQGAGWIGAVNWIKGRLG